MRSDVTKRFLLCVLSGLVLCSTNLQAKLPAFREFFKSSSLGPVKSKESAHFVVSWVHPRDEVIVDALLEHIEWAHRDLEPIFKDQSSTHKAPVEIFPDLKDFSEVSGLSMARFRATGTIALTLEQRMMILFPRNLAFGYGWAETVVHEYIHYLIREISENMVPIWLHEGTAQLFQGYPYEKKPVLKPAQWGLFKKYKKQNKLLSLKSLQEPFPYKKDPEEAELSYVQALLFADWLNQSCGAIQLIRWAEAAQDLGAALEKCTKKSYKDLDAEFLPKIMAQVKIPEGSDVEFYARDFSGRDPVEVEGQKKDRESRNFAELGSRLFNQGRFRASAFEMDRAIHKTPAPPPSWQRQLAVSYQRANDLSKSAQVLDKLLKDYPEDASGWFLRAAQLKKEKKHLESWNALLHAFFVNPFLESLTDEMHLLKEEFPKFSYSFNMHKD